MSPPPALVEGRNETSLLVQISESCARHRLRHEKQQSHHGAGEENMSTFCQESIKTLRKIVPKIERQYHASTNPQAEDIGHICDFYEQLIEGDFCPHAPDALRQENGPLNGTLNAFNFLLFETRLPFLMFLPLSVAANIFFI
jgi:hypothetical protein